MLDRFSAATQQWFTESFPAVTAVQAQGWPAIADGHHTLLFAPTGSGKTLAAFLACLDRLALDGPPEEPGVRVLYISPLKALVNDVQRNLERPRLGIARAAHARGESLYTPTVSVRTGDTSSAQRRRLQREPPDVLCTTPESLFLLLGSGQRELLRSVQTVILDEIHVLASSKRGVHLALSLERLAELTDVEPQRIGLSATQRPLERVAAFLGGGRDVVTIDTSEPPRLDLLVTAPQLAGERRSLPEGSGGGQRQTAPSVKPALHAQIVQWIREHTSTLVFVGSRLACEQMVQALNELAGEELVYAHHGSVALAQRTLLEGQLKRGEVRALVATSSLELGIDMGAIDLVVMVGSPGSVASGLQRIGRAGHGVGQTSRGMLVPKWPGDVLESAAIAERMVAGQIETTAVPELCLDVLAQHVVSAVSVEPQSVEDVLRWARRAYPYRALSAAALGSVLDMLSGRLSLEALPELRPLVVWDRETGELRGRRGAGTLALLNAGTIPDRGVYGVFAGQGGPRVGELDEEMVFESRPGDVVVLGASSWRIEAITRDQVWVVPAPGEAGRLPFFRGESPARPVELGAAVGALVRQLEASEDRAELLSERTPLAPDARNTLLAYLRDEADAGGVPPTDRRLVVQRVRDALGDWRVVVLSARGRRVHEPWALAVQRRLEAHYGESVRVMATDDGLVFRLPDAATLPPTALLLPSPDELRDLVVEQLRHSALFASVFRDCAGRSLLLPRRSISQRRPLWQQRLRAQSLLSAVADQPAFPVVLEAFRECLRDRFDLPALEALLTAVQQGEVEVVEVDPPAATPFARSVVYRYTAEFLYAGDVPAAERRAAALSLDRDLLAELLGEVRLRDLLDADAVREVEERLSGTHPDRRVAHADALVDLLRLHGALDRAAIVARCEDGGERWLDALVAARRVLPIRVGMHLRYIAVEDAGRYQAALGVDLPSDLPAAYLEAGDEPLVALARRVVSRLGPFREAQLAQRLGVPTGVAQAALERLAARGEVVRAPIRPGVDGEDWCHPDVLQQLRRASLQRQRAQIEAVEPAVYARFLYGWHGLHGRRGGHTALRDALRQLEGLPVALSDLDQRILPARVEGYRAGDVDQLGALGELVWIGHAPQGKRDARIALYRRDRVPLLLDPPEPGELSELERAVLDHLEQRGASFFVALSLALQPPSDAELAEALWSLVWQGCVTNDTLMPLRSRGGRRSATALGGRWSAVSELVAASPGRTRRSVTRAEQLLDRLGVVSREATVGTPGGFGALYSVFGAMEDSGKVRRGRFVEGLSAAQFARPGVVDQLRAQREHPLGAVVLAACDPANPYGDVLAWPLRDGQSAPARRPGALVVLVDGEAVLYVSSTGRHWTTLAPADDASRFAEAVDALCAEARQLRVERVDGAEPRGTSWEAPLVERGFRPDYKGLSWRR